MSLFSTESLAARSRRVKAGKHVAFDTASVLTEKINEQARKSTFDIFLSHAFSDKDTVLSVTGTLEDLGFSVYLDWREDVQLDRKNVTATTANILRQQMKKCKCLFFATTESSSNSKWMPWELGFMDGLKARAAVLPIKDASTKNYAGQEYLGIYPYVTQQKDTNDKERLWVRNNSDTYIVFEKWLAGNEPYKRN